MKFRLFLSLALAICSNISQAQEVDKYGYAETPINRTAEVLPPDYKGQNPVLLFFSLSKIAKPKEEFETTAQFEARQKSVLNSPLIGNLNVNDVFASIIPLDIGSSITEYNADKQEMKVEVLADEILFFPPAFLLFQSETNKGSYEAKNAFGATRQVMKSERNSMRLVFLNLKDFGFKAQGGITALNYKVPISINLAKEAKVNMKMLALYSVKLPYVGLVPDSKRPTLQSPTDVTILDNLIYADIKEFWFFDGESGRIYQKILPKKKK